MTMLFTDVEGSTRLLHELGASRYAEALMAHRERIRAAAAGRAGVEMGTEGDAFFFVFQSAGDCLAAAGEMQIALADGPLRVRMGIHSGEVLLVEGDYVGMAVHKAARISSVAHGGQVVVSAQTRALVDVPLRDLGEHRLKDLTVPERLYQLGDGEFPPLRTLRHVHLPVQATPLLGRERELAELLELAESHRLVTLTGTGGTGKTRLSLALAAERSDRYVDGVWWVSLAAVSDPELVVPAIAAAVGGVEDFPAYLGDRSLLLVLDNMEQVVDAAPAIGELLARAPQCAAIVTSRERLAISGEQEYPVGPLSPQDAVELFTARARQVKPDFEPGVGVEAICERLDRLPLALELAATRVKLLSEDQLLTRLEQRLPLLAGGRRDLPARQATMRAAIAWSYDLLGETEQRLFGRLAVFVGGFELEAAERICDAGLEELQSLIDKSLLREGDRGRFFLLETTREYALECLAASGEEDDLGARHAAWFFALGVAASSAGPEQGEILGRLRQDPGNVSIALAWGLEHDLAAAVPLADVLFFSWLGAGRLEELRRWYAQALADSGALSASDRATVLMMSGVGHVYAERPDAGRAAMIEALALFREHGDERGEVRVLNHLVGFEFISGTPERGLAWHEQALEIAERLGDPQQIARSLHYMGENLREMGSYDQAAERYIRSIEILRANGLSERVSSVVHSLADLRLDTRDLPAADSLYREALAFSQNMNDIRLTAYCLAGLSCVAALGGDGHTAGLLWGLAERIEREHGVRMLGTERRRYEAVLVLPISDGDEFRAGITDAQDADPTAVVLSLLGATP
ncbi:MAG TPA: tetratricopeptide repeat protein [Solirubrobacteraceae bacterium]